MHNDGQVRMRFRLFNIPIYIDLSFWLFLLFCCNTPTPSLADLCTTPLILGLSILFHEYGHAFAALRYGRRPEIVLQAFGGYTVYPNRGVFEKQEFLITLSGPLFTAILIVVSYWLLKSHIFSSYLPNLVLYRMMDLNIYWLIVNLAPLQPLDGGQMMEYLLRKWLGPERGVRANWLLGNLTALLGAVYFLFDQAFFFAVLFLVYGWKNFQASPFRKQEPPPSDCSLYHQAIRALEHQEKEKAQALLQKLIKAKDEHVKARSSESLANLWEKEGKTKEAYLLLLKADVQKLKMGKWLLCKLGYMQKNYRLVAQMAHEVYEVNPTLETALLNAKAFGRLGNAEQATGWLRTALQFEEAKTLALDPLLADPAFDPIREDPLFQEWVAEHLAVS